jgi:hypothetical protein
MPAEGRLLQGGNVVIVPLVGTSLPTPQMWGRRCNQSTPGQGDFSSQKFLPGWPLASPAAFLFEHSWREHGID